MQTSEKYWKGKSINRQTALGLLGPQTTRANDNERKEGEQ